MYCERCGTKMGDGAKFCPACGMKVEMVPDKNTSEWYIENVYNDMTENTNPVYSPVYASDNETQKKRFSFLKFVGMLFAAFGIFVVITMLIPEGVLEVEVTDIEKVQSSTLTAYDYGITIGDSLDNWFQGSEEWDSYTDNGTTYVVAKGTTNYTLTGEPETQLFLFRIVDEQHFQFINATNLDGDKIYTTTSDARADLYLEFVNDIFSTYGQEDTYEIALEAAFGNKEMLERVQRASQ